jgi:hypothetical protein
MQIKNLPIDAREDAIASVLRMAKCDKFIVTGSYALYRMGLVKDSNDIDLIIVNPDATTKDILLFWQKVFPAETKAPKGMELWAIFKFKGIKIDVFIPKTFSETTIKTDRGYELATVPCIVKAKRRQNRLKDWLQLKAMANLIFKQKDFDAYLETTPIPIIIGTDEYLK